MMLFMDLAVDNAPIAHGWPCFGNIPVLPVESYLRLFGAFAFVDTQALEDPSWEELNARFLLLHADTASVEVPLDATPVQNLTIPINTHNYAIGLYEMPIETTQGASPLPVGAGAGYIRQALFSANAPVAVPPHPRDMP